MSQVLRCYKCEVFQVHPAKKSLKWKCKMCNEKQSIKRRYGIGTGKECRIHVQKLNVLRGNIDQLQENIDSLSDEDDEANDDESTIDYKKKTYSGKSKWADFVTKKESEYVEVPNSTMYFNDVEVVLEATKTCKKKNLGNNLFTNKTSFKKLPWNRSIKKNSKEVNDEEDSSNTIAVDVKSEPKKKFVHPKLSTDVKTTTRKSKWDDFTIGTADSDSGVMCLVSQYQQTKSCNQPPSKSFVSTTSCVENKSKTVKSISKWEQFVPKDEDIEPKKIALNDDTKVAENLSKDNLQNIFSLCGDNELDDVLNF